MALQNLMWAPSSLKFCQFDDVAFIDRMFISMGNLLSVHLAFQFSKLNECKLLTI